MFFEYPSPSDTAVFISPAILSLIPEASENDLNHMRFLSFRKQKYTLPKISASLLKKTSAFQYWIAIYYGFLVMLTAFGSASRYISYVPEMFEMSPVTLKSKNSTTSVVVPFVFTLRYISFPKCWKRQYFPANLPLLSLQKEPPGNRLFFAASEICETAFCAFCRFRLLFNCAVEFHPSITIGSASIALLKRQSGIRAQIAPFGLLMMHSVFLRISYNIICNK